MSMNCFYLAQPPLVSCLTLLWTIARFLDPFYTFSPAHRRVICNFTLPNPFFYFECIGIQFFNSLTYDLRDIMPRQKSLTLIPREAEHSLGVTINLSICLCTHSQIDCNQFTIILGLHLYMSILEKLLLVVKTLIKNIEQQPH